MARIVLYAIVAVMGVTTLGYLTHEQAFYYAAIPCGLFVVVFGFVGDQARTNQKLAEAVAELKKQNGKKTDKRDP